MDSDEEVDDVPEWKGLSGCILLIAADPNNYSSTKISIEASRRLLRHTMLSKSYVLGLCLYGTKETETTFLGFKNIIEVIPLEVPTLQSLKKLDNLDIDRYGCSDTFKLSDVLWQCSQMFAKCRPRLAERNVYLLSHLGRAPQKDDQRNSLKRIYDFFNFHINLKVINVAKDHYEIDPFYVEILRAQTKGDEIQLPPPLSRVDDIEILMRQRSHKNLASSRIPFHITKDLTIAIGIYNLIKIKTEPKSVKLDGKTNQTITSSSCYVKTVPSTSSEGPSTSSGAPEERETPLLKSELCKYQHYGGEDIKFSVTEINNIKNIFGPPAVKLLGFKPKSSLQKEKWYFKPCSFMFPIEEAIEGSTTAFRALHEACTDRSVVAICTLFSRINSNIRLVALVPTVLQRQSVPGFDVVFLPYIENMKDIPDVDVGDEEDENINQDNMIFMQDMIGKLMFDYSYKTFQNPKLQKLYRTIEALALEQENAETVEDTTLPSVERFDDIDAEHFHHLFGSFTITAPTKRSAPGEDRNAKRFQVEPPDELLLKVRLNSRDIHKFNVNDLKQILRWKNPPTLPALTGVKKGELVEMVYKFCEEQ